MNDMLQIAALTQRIERLERSGRLWRRLALAVLVAALSAAFAGTAWPLADDDQPEPKAAGLADDDQPEPKAAEKPGPGSHIELARARLGLSRRALGIVRNAAREGANIINQREDYYRWSYRMLGDQIYLSMSDDDPRVADPEVYLAVSDARPSPARLAAFEDHLKRMQAWEDFMRPFYNDQILSAIGFFDIQSYRLEAQLWLARERLKEARQREKDAAKDQNPPPENQP